MYAQQTCRTNRFVIPAGAIDAKPSMIRGVFKNSLNALRAVLNIEVRRGQEYYSSAMFRSGRWF